MINITKDLYQFFSPLKIISKTSNKQIRKNFKIFIQEQLNSLIIRLQYTHKVEQNLNVSQLFYNKNRQNIDKNIISSVQELKDQEKSLPPKIIARQDTYENAIAIRRSMLKSAINPRQNS
ncbi:hypothetical protein pb186bvf_018759 [Paramecium bursaria]